MTQANLPIIVTRAEPGASETMKRLEARGLNAVLAPMLSLHELPETPMPDAADISGLVFTSANGVRTYAARRDDRHLPAWCVGPATAQAAQDAGFKTVHESAGNAVDLANFIAAKSAPSNQSLLHVANSAAAGTLKETLEAQGYRTVFAPIYEMRPAQTLLEQVTNLLDKSAKTILLLHSEKGASAFAALTKTIALSQCIGVAISARAVAPLEHANLSAIYIADAPNEDGLFAALEGALATLSA